MDDIVERVKEAVRIEDVIEESGISLARRHGRYMRGQGENDDLVIDTMKGVYHWHKRSEHGDVFNWVMNRTGMDFKSALEELCRRANLPAPQWSREELDRRKASREKEDILGVAQAVFARWLKNDPEAWGYCTGRGWTEETIEAAGLGFSGRAAAAEFADMKGEFAMHEIDLEHPAAVAVLGFRGDVTEWGRKWMVEVQANWVEWKLAPGMMGKTRLCYAHFWGGRVRYMTGRNILGAEVNEEGRTIKSWNMPKALMGERTLYFNHAYRGNAEEVVLVEGQADAVTLGQWGYAAIAWAGTGWKDHEPFLREMGKRHKRIYLALDADEAGGKALVGDQQDWPLAKVLGPMTRVVRWRSDT